MQGFFVITIAGYGVTFGVCQNKIEQNTKDIARVERVHEADINKVNTRQTSTETLLNSINSQLVELNTKMQLLIDGKL